MEKIMNLRFCDLIYYEEDKSIKKERENYSLKRLTATRDSFGLK